MKLNFLFVLCVVIVIYGCDYAIGTGDPMECIEFDEWKSNSNFVAIVDDSLAILRINRRKSLCKGELNPLYDNFGLFLINYRVKQKPLLGSILDRNFQSGSSNFVRGYYIDSSVAVFYEIDNFSFCKIGIDSIKVNKINNYVGKITYYDVRNVQPWKDGNMLLNGRDDNWYIFDTKAGQIELFDLYNEYKWLTESDEAILYFENKMVSIRKNTQTNNFELIVNGNITDTLDSLYPPDSWPYIYGRNYIAITTDNGMEKIHKIDTINFKFDKTFEPLWISGSKFYKNDSDFVQYFADDLIEADD